jgi:deazaflavin-dependent oxidoreductase (nitroreductase family)
MAPVTTHVFNPVMRLVAGRVPGLGILTHMGRRTGRAYPTPVLVFRRGDRYLIGLWYGSSVEWVKNVLAAGGCDLRVGGRERRLAEPELIEEPDLRLLPAPMRLGGRLVGLHEFMRLRPA